MGMFSVSFVYMKYNFNSDRLKSFTSIRLTETQYNYIEEVAKTSKVPMSRVIRRFLDAGINDYKENSK